MFTISRLQTSQRGGACLKFKWTIAQPKTDILNFKNTVFTSTNDTLAHTAPTLLVWTKQKNKTMKVLHSTNSDLRHRQTKETISAANC